MFRVIVLAVLAASGAWSQNGNAELEDSFRAGDKALAESRYADAEKLYEKVRQLAPGMADVYGRLGLVYFQQKRYAEAVPVLRHGLKLKPSLPKADILLAMSLSELGRFAEALTGLQK